VLISHVQYHTAGRAKSLMYCTSVDYIWSKPSHGTSIVVIFYQPTEYFHRLLLLLSIAFILLSTLCRYLPSIPRLVAFSHFSNKAERRTQG
jgi:hypothetical protein